MLNNFPYKIAYRVCTRQVFVYIHDKISCTYTISFMYVHDKNYKLIVHVQDKFGVSCTYTITYIVYVHETYVVYVHDNLCHTYVIIVYMSCTNT